MQPKGKKTTPRTKLLIVVLIVCFVLIIAGRLGCGQQPPPPPTPTPVTVDLKINGQDGAATVAYGESATLSWVATGATSCVAYGSWSGAKSLSGTETTGPITGNSGYTIACVGPGGSASDHVSASVATPTPTATATRPNTVTAVPSHTPTQTGTATATPTQTGTPTPVTPTVPPTPTPVMFQFTVAHPKGMVMDSFRQRLFVASKTENRVFVFGTLRGEKIAEIPVGQEPWGVTMVADKIFVGNHKSATVSVINPWFWKPEEMVTATIDLSECGNGPANLTANTNTGRVYAALYGSARVTVIDAATNTMVDCIPTGAGTFGVAINPSLNYLYVTNRDAKTLQTFDASVVPARLVQTKELHGVPFFVQADKASVYAMVAFDAPDYSRADGLMTYRATENGLELFDASTIGNTGDGGWVLPISDRYVAIAATGDGEVEVLDLDYNKIAYRIPMVQPFGVAADKGRLVFYVGDKEAGVVKTFRIPVPR